MGGRRIRIGWYVLSAMLCLILAAFSPASTLADAPHDNVKTTNTRALWLKIKKPPAPGEDALSDLPDLRGEASPTTYVTTTVIEWGEGISEIAGKCGTTRKKILELNPGLTVRSLVVGQAIRVVQSWDEPPVLDGLHRELVRGLRGRKEIALTFDAGWTTEKDLDRLLDVLDKHGVHGSFFLTGIFLRSQSDGAARIIADGHAVYNHTDTHPHCTQLNDQAIREQLLAVEQTVKQQAGATTKPFWRPPFGERDARVRRAAARAGFRSAYWTIDSLDWLQGDDSAAEKVFERVCVRPFEKRPNDPDPLDGAIVLFHVHGRATVDALDLIIPYLHRRGYHFVKLERLMEP